MTTQQEHQKSNKISDQSNSEELAEKSGSGYPAVDLKKISQVIIDSLNQGSSPESEMTQQNMSQNMHTDQKMNPNTSQEQKTPFDEAPAETQVKFSRMPSGVAKDLHQNIKLARTGGEAESSVPRGNSRQYQSEAPVKPPEVIDDNQLGQLAAKSAFQNSGMPGYQQTTESPKSSGETIPIPSLAQMAQSAGKSAFMTSGMDSVFSNAKQTESNKQSEQDLADDETSLDSGEPVTTHDPISTLQETLQLDAQLASQLKSFALNAGPFAASQAAEPNPDQMNEAMEQSDGFFQDMAKNRQTVCGKRMGVVNQLMGKPDAPPSSEEIIEDPLKENKIPANMLNQLRSGLLTDIPVVFGGSPFNPSEKKQNKASSTHGPGFDANGYRKDFPILQRKVNGKPLVWFDNAATTQKPQQVIDKLAQYYQEYNSNIHRGAHTLASEATEAYENARKKVQRFLNAGKMEEIIFTRGTTESINLVSNTYGKANLMEGDEIVLTILEHHSNIVPWQMLAKEKNAILKVAPVNEKGEILLDDYEQLFTRKTRIAAITHASNAIGTVPPIKSMIEIAHRHGAIVLVDGAQSVPHFSTNVQELDADFYVFSGHKLFGPTGIGVLYGKKELLETMPPWQGGGSMIKDVRFEQTEFSDPPEKFEAGTPNIADAIGLGAAIDYLTNIGMDNIHRRESELLKYGTEKLSQIPGVRFIGTASDKIGVLSFIMEGTTPDEIGKELDREGIAVRTGHHCAQPILRNFGLESTVRPSFAFYNLKSEIDKMIDVLIRIRGLHPV
jgi:SufS family cysteine desulfurase